MSKIFKKFLENNNLPYIRLYDLRHSDVTILIDSNVLIKVISERLRHLNVNTIINVYSHIFKEMYK
ncbi:tyrosine-type recombinase/integrase [Clostridioides difficile]|uniref:tyrosine-type recombinase/integrase n=1 Tax=Clostridioides difficile TaxID=1496 RepID=UPI000D1FCB8A|nr:tyrosine-type recombinase/integrase [Clostridioides difficile]MDL5067042.1 tyrosine-type recombinase/integrase [Clostridioides difficile]MDN9452768.1 tyrosine-type recombinase/integrase [Clostridioides difficile]HBF7898055.1 tyrosine-type recombinase/integrase [Clostridioides difficile]